MSRFAAPAVPTAAAALIAAALLGACGSSDDTPAGAKTLAFELTDAGCVPNEAKAPPGPIVFEVENTGTTAGTEFEVLEGDTILGEKENLSDGLHGSFTLILDEGEYTLYCPGGSDERGRLTVSASSEASASPAD